MQRTFLIRRLATLSIGLFLGSGCTVNVPPDLLNNLPFTNELKAPTLSNISAVPSQNGAMLTWTTDQSADSMVEYGIDTHYGATSTLSSTLVTGHSVSLTGLDANTVYHFRVHSRNFFGTEAISSDRTFLTLSGGTSGGGGGGPNGPVISAISVSWIRPCEAWVHWVTDEAANSIVEFGMDSQYGQSVRLDAEITTHWVQLTGLAPSTQYHYRVTSIDDAGFEQQSEDQVFTTLADPLHVPVLTGITASGITSASAVISWNTDIPSNSKVQYAGSDGIWHGIFRSELVTSHQVSLSDLSPATHYSFRVASTSSFGVTAESGACYGFQTTGQAVVPLSINGLMTANPFAQKMDIQYTTDRPASTQIDYGTSPSYGSSTGVDSALVTSHAKTLTSLQPNTTYYFRVTSVDQNGVTASQNGQFKTDTLDVAYIRHLYMDLLGRTAGNSDLASVLQLLQSYEASQSPSAARKSVAQWIGYGLEFRTVEINKWYLTALGRSADGTDLSGGLGWHGAHMQHDVPNTVVPISPASDAYALYDWEKVQRDLMVSAEAWVHYGSNCDSWVAGTYQVFLGRGSSQTERAGWTAQCNQDPLQVQLVTIGGSQQYQTIRGGSTLASVIQGIALSDEGLRWQANQLYVQLLGRQGDSVGLVSWETVLQQGKRYIDTLAGMASSDEYYQKP